MSGRVWVIVLAGGCGTRLAAESQRQYGYPRPKQFCDFDGGGTLLAKTLRRARRIVPEERIVVVTTRRWRTEALETLQDFPRLVHVEQPRAIDTTPGVALPLLHVLARDPHATVVMMPSDHDVANDALFAKTGSGAAALAMIDRERLVIVGARTQGFEDGYGWIVPQAAPNPACGVARFREKPERAEVDGLLAAGALVNTFVIAGAASAFAAAIRARAPGQWRVLSQAWADAHRLEAAYSVLPSSNFSTEVLGEEIDRLRVVELPPCGWSDVGTPERLHASIRRSREDAHAAK